MLPINFHRTFMPERYLIAALLDYAALGKMGTLQEISADTGIPMGKVNGKTPAIIDYARGMGLIEVQPGAKKGTKVPNLTSLGRAVFKEDRLLGEGITQWIAHMNLCRSDIGALAWNVVFNKGRNVLGTRFDTRQLEECLVGICSPNRSRMGKGELDQSRTGPLLKCYLEDVALARTQAIAVSGGMITRKKAPLLEVYARAHTAFLLELIEAYFPGQNQVTVADLQASTGWLNICLWNERETGIMCALMEGKGYISIDRQMQPWIIEKLKNAEEVWPHIWDDL